MMTEQMKPSGIAWIGDIPESWNISRVKYRYDISLGKMLQPIQESATDTLEYYMCSANITWEGIELSPLKQMWFGKNEKEQYRLKTGDLLVAEGGDVAVSCIWKDELPECYLQNAAHRVRHLYSNDNRFLYYWIYFCKSHGYIDQICNKATISHFTKEKFGETPICIMGLPEQRAIADYLNAKCAKIDSIAADLEKQIELLQKYKKSLITETVTKGLDKTVPMKDSGIEWIGEIPEHWNVKKLKYICEKIGDVDHYMPESVDVGIPYVMTGDFIGDGNDIDFENCKQISRNDFERLSKKICPIIGDVLFARYATIGTVRYVDTIRDFLISYSCAIIRPNSVKLLGKYLYYFIKSSSFYEEACKYINANTQGNIGIDSISRMKIPLSPIDEQKMIVQYLDEKCERIDLLLESKSLLLEKIQQHKKSLIYEYVTGKKRVKEVKEYGD